MVKDSDKSNLRKGHLTLDQFKVTAILAGKTQQQEPRQLTALCPQSRGKDQHLLDDAQLPFPFGCSLGPKPRKWCCTLQSKQDDCQKHARKLNSHVGSCFPDDSRVS